MDLVFWIIKFSVILGIIFFIAAYATLAERKIAAWTQDRFGPNRVGPTGLFQPIADGFKSIFKECLIPEKADRFLFALGPFLTLSTGLITLAIVPFASLTWDASPLKQPYDLLGLDYIIKDNLFSVGNVNVGILFFLAISALSTYGIAYGGWGSNNKFSLIGSIRSAAQLVSFEVSMGLVLVSLFMTVGSLTLEDIIKDQISGVWLILKQPLAFVLFLVAAFAETNRAPFDIPEAESELVSGYHTEFSSMHYAGYMLGEYLSMITMCGIIVTLFLGGWHFPWVGSWLKDSSPEIIYLVSSSIFFVKLISMIFFFMWVRWTLPRFRWDQLMTLGWKILLPLAFLNIFLVGIFKLLKIDLIKAIFNV